MENNELLKAIIKELQETNKILHKFLTNGGTVTEDAIHTYIESMDRKVDGIANKLNSLK